MDDVMADPDTENNLRQERQALRLLCSNLIRPLTRVELCKLLAPALFQDALHRVAFEEIQTAGAIPAARLREALPARITNRGFPDFELGDLLGQHTASETEIEELFLSVLQLIRLRHASDDELQN
jgi:hypothetical protein